MGTKGREEANQAEKRGLAFGIGTERGEEGVCELIGVLESVEGVNGEGTNGLIDRARRGVEGKGREENGGSGREGFGQERIGGLERRLGIVWDRFVSLPIGERKAIEWIARLRAGLVERIVDRAKSRQLLNTRESTSKSARFTELFASYFNVFSIDGMVFQLSS